MCRRLKYNKLQLGNLECTYKNKTENTYYNVTFDDELYHNHKYLINNINVYDKLILVDNTFYLYHEDEVVGFYIDEKGMVKEI